MFFRGGTLIAVAEEIEFLFRAGHYLPGTVEYVISQSP